MDVKNPELYADIRFEGICQKKCNGKGRPKSVFSVDLGFFQNDNFSGLSFLVYFFAQIFLQN
jgi:hypothetical protein